MDSYRFLNRFHIPKWHTDEALNQRRKNPPELFLLPVADKVARYDHGKTVQQPKFFGLTIPCCEPNLRAILIAPSFDSAPLLEKNLFHSRNLCKFWAAAVCQGISNKLLV